MPMGIAGGQPSNAPLQPGCTSQAARCFLDLQKHWAFKILISQWLLEKRQLCEILRLPGPAQDNRIRVMPKEKFKQTEQLDELLG